MEYYSALRGNYNIHEPQKHYAKCERSQMKKPDTSGSIYMNRPEKANQKEKSVLVVA